MWYVTLRTSLDFQHLQAFFSTHTGVSQCVENNGLGELGVLSQRSGAKRRIVQFGGSAIYIFTLIFRYLFIYLIFVIRI